MAIARIGGQKADLKVEPQAEASQGHDPLMTMEKK